MRQILSVLGVICLVGLSAAPAQDHKPAQEQRRVAAAEEEQLVIPQVPLTPGGGAPISQTSPNAAEYDGNEDMIQAGKQLYSAMNCVGCHSHGGGGMGPALMDDRWIYGSSIEHIFSSIREGRPNGMPSFRGRLPDEQIWQIAAFVRSIPKQE
ncbi:cytochrome c [Hyphomicrobium sp. CS1GBMeth3]|uniref:c-type cytochrome n=1 Tax=Hyphomicrobium sp. CS1GBMeth3 TaxID=1892845 RepID=UPI000931C16F|nr:cytochrome c [Hyphomicrobium sp. CS1GBMeth3]